MLIEDATVSANTAIDFAKKLRKKGLIVKDVVTILDVGKSAKDNLKKEGIRLHPLFTWKVLYDYFKDKNAGLISREMELVLNKFIGG